MHPSTVHNYLVRSRTRKWNAAGEFKVQPVTFVDAEGNRIERVAAPDPLLSQPESESAHGMKEAPRIRSWGNRSPGAQSTYCLVSPPDAAFSFICAHREISYLSPSDAF
jgi:hypothetical protein